MITRRMTAGPFPSGRRPGPGSPWPAAISACVLAAAAGGAHAQAAAQTLDPRLAYRAEAMVTAPSGAQAAGAPARPATDLAGLKSAFALDYARANPASMAGFSKTAIDHRFAPDALVGSVGYLCGLHKEANETSGPASSYEPEGTYLGAKLRYAF